MAEGDELLDKADALMRRHRVFVAGATAPSAPSTEDVDDVPVLTEVVADVIDAAPVTPLDREALRSALAFELETWLDEELPQHVMRVLDGITDQLIIQLSLKARAELLPRLQAALETASPPAKPETAGE